jgi:WD40 repeat protein
MKKYYILLISFFLVAIPGVACSPANETIQTQPGVQSIPTLPISVSRTATSTNSTILPTPTGTLRPTDLPTASPSAHTSTHTPYLPADLVRINPQNVSKLEPAAALPEQGASVVTYSPDSHRIAAGFFRTNNIKIWDLNSGQELLTLSGHVDPRIIRYLVYSPDGLTLASGAQGWYAENDSLILWDAVNGRELERFDGVLGAISPDWRTIALSQREQEERTTLILSDLDTDEVIHTLEAPNDIYEVSFSPTGHQIAAFMADVIQDLFSFWSVDSGRLERTLYDWLGFSLSPDGRFIAALVKTSPDTHKGELNIFDAATFKWIKTLAKEIDTYWYVVPAFSPDGQILAVSSGERVILWETHFWSEVASLPASDPTGLVFSPDGTILTTYTHSGPVQLWGVMESQ